MRPREHSRGQHDLFQPRRDQIIAMGHELVRLGGLIDWQAIGARLGAMHDDGPGQPPLPARLMAGLAILKHMHVNRQATLHLARRRLTHWALAVDQRLRPLFCHS